MTDNVNGIKTCIVTDNVNGIKTCIMTDNVNENQNVYND